MSDNVMIVIHRHRRGWLNYDVLYRCGTEPPPDHTEYKVDCPCIKRLIESGEWCYLGSGDTAHIPEWLRDLGIRGPSDVIGLIGHLRRLYPDAIIVIDNTCKPWL